MSSTSGTKASGANLTQNFLEALAQTYKVQKKDYGDKSAEETHKQEIKSEIKHAQQQVENVKNPVLAQAVARDPVSVHTKESFVPKLLESNLPLNLDKERDLLGKIQNSLDFLSVLHSGEGAEQAAFFSQNNEQSHNPLPQSKLASSASKPSSALEEVELPSLNAPHLSKEEAVTPGYHKNSHYEGASEGYAAQSFRNSGNTQFAVCALFEAYFQILDNSSRNTLQFAATSVQTNKSNLTYLEGSLSHIETLVVDSYEKNISAATAMKAGATMGALQGLQGAGSMLTGLGMPTGANRKIAEVFGHTEQETLQNTFSRHALPENQTNSMKSNLQALEVIDPKDSTQHGVVAPLLSEDADVVVPRLAEHVTNQYSSNGPDNIHLGTLFRRLSTKTATSQYKEGFIKQGLKSTSAEGEGMAPGSPQELKSREKNFTDAVQTNKAVGELIDKIETTPLFATTVEGGVLRSVKRTLSLGLASSAGTVNGQAQITDFKNFGKLELANAPLKENSNATAIDGALRERGLANNTVGSRVLKYGEDKSNPRNPQAQKPTHIEDTLLIVEGKKVTVVSNQSRLNDANEWESETGLSVVATFEVDDNTAANIQRRGALDLFQHADIFARFKKTGNDFVGLQKQLDTSLENVNTKLNSANNAGDSVFTLFGNDYNEENKQSFHLSQDHFHDGVVQFRLDNTRELMAKNHQEMAQLQAQPQNPDQQNDAQQRIKDCQSNIKALDTYATALEEALQARTAYKQLDQKTSNIYFRNKDEFLEYPDLNKQTSGLLERTQNYIKKGDKEGLVHREDFKQFQDFYADMEKVKPILDQVGIGGKSNTPAARMGAEAERRATIHNKWAHITGGMAQTSGTIFQAQSSQYQAQSQNLQAEGQKIGGINSAVTTQTQQVQGAQTNSKNSQDQAVQTSEGVSAQVSQTFAQAINSAAR